MKDMRLRKLEYALDLQTFVFVSSNFLQIEVWAYFLYSFWYAKASERYKNLLTLYKVYVRRIQL
jgi:hypothetical protein